MDSKSNVPIITLEKCNDELILSQIKSLISFYTSHTGTKPEYVIKSPGRVNLIGEHIDYCGYPVFPMAIEKNILIAVGRTPNKSTINLFNQQEELYQPYSVEWNNLTVNSPPEWKDYVLCGVKGVHDIINKNNNQDLTSGLNMAISGTLAPSAGLSSSSALVCGSSVATWFTFCPNEQIDKSTFANYCANFERMIGTAGGGMDQAIQFLAEKGSAKYVQFIPKLNSIPIYLPEGANFYISHSGVSCNKGATNYYNTRVLETRLAAAIIAKSTNLIIENFNGEITLSKVQKELNVSLDEMIKNVENILQEKPYTLQDAMNVLSCKSDDQLFKLISTSNFNRLKSVTKESTLFEIRKRALHVFKEASRVESFKQTCQDESMSNEEKILRLGELMNESHSSCRDLYDCSCKELNNLVDKSRQCGALGSRLTGAGWGGCTISLVRQSEKDLYEARMKEFFKDDQFTFNTMPSDGITVYLLN